MEFKLSDCLAHLKRTPLVIQYMLRDIPDIWLEQNEGDESWNTKEIVAHLVLGERTDWILRADQILHRENKTFEPFDMNGHIKPAQTKSIRTLCNEFSRMRSLNIAKLREWDLTNEDLQKTGFHPEFGEVTLQQHLATWMAHDHSHIAQISRVFAKQYKENAGPWKKYLRILQE